jgi:hypothetical protein
MTMVPRGSIRSGEVGAGENGNYPMEGRIV